jgi:hypothetical protein
MNTAIQTAVEVFNSKVLPVLKKWNYTVALTESSPTHVLWEFRWDNLASQIEVSFKKNTLLKTKETTAYVESLLISGGLYCSVNDPYKVNDEVIFQRLKNAVKGAIVFSCRRELERIHFCSEEAISKIWWKTETIEWVTKDCLYSCTLTVSLSKRRPSWRWVCKFGEYKPYTYCPMSLLCEITPNGTANPTEAFLKFLRSIVAEALL